MPNCCVPGCGNKSTDPRCVDITFHRLPINNKELLKDWIEKLNLNSYYNNNNCNSQIDDIVVVPDHHRVCSDHFDINCFRQPPAPPPSSTLSSASSSSLTSSTKRCLVSGSIPNKFDPITANTLKSNSENIEGKHLCWSNPPSLSLSLPLPLILVYFQLERLNLTTLTTDTVASISTSISIFILPFVHL